MNHILLTLGALTLGGSAAVILLACASRSTRGRYGAKWRCWAWVLLCLRLAFPLPLVPQVQTQAPIQMDIPPAPVITPAPAPPVSPGNDSGASTSEPSPGQSGGQTALTPAPAVPTPQTPAAPAETESSQGFSLTQTVLGIWLAGAAVMLVWNLWAHLRFLAYLRRWAAPVTSSDAIQAFNQLGDRLGLDRRPRLLVCQGLKVPMLAGVFRPAILLPQGNISGEELAFSLLHELTHYRRRDIWLKTLAMWVNALHWFNPLSWYMVRLVERDTELACDEDALRRLNPEDFAAYGQTILNAVARLQNGKDICHE